MDSVNAHPRCPTGTPVGRAGSPTLGTRVGDRQHRTGTCWDRMRGWHNQHEAPTMLCDHDSPGSSALSAGPGSALRDPRHRSRAVHWTTGAAPGTLRISDKVSQPRGGWRSSSRRAGLMLGRSTARQSDRWTIWKAHTTERLRVRSFSFPGNLTSIHGVTVNGGRGGRLRRRTHKWAAESVRRIHRHQVPNFSEVSKPILPSTQRDFVR